MAIVTPVQAVKRKKAARAYAVKNHIPLPKGFRVNTPLVGKQARELVRRIEKQAFPKHAPTGEFNSRVLALLFPPRKYPIGLIALGKARREIGVKEQPAGTNSGPRVSQYLAVCGINHQPWCACFVTWCLRQAGWKTKGWNQAYVPAWVATAHAGKYRLRVVGKAEVKQGDIVCYDWNNDGVADHIGFVLLPPCSGSFTAIEGNTSVSNNSNGGQVMVRPRSISDVACFIRVDA